MMFYVLYETYYILAKYKQKLESECISRPKHYAQCSRIKTVWFCNVRHLLLFSVYIMYVFFLK